MTAGNERAISNVTIRQALDLVRHRLGEEAVVEVHARSGDRRSLDELTDMAGWSTYGEFRRILETCAHVLGGSHAFSEVADSWDSDRGVPEVVAMFQSLGSPQAFLAEIAGISAKFTTVHILDLVEVGDDYAVVCATNRSDFPRYRELCDFTAGLLSIGPKMFGHDTGKVVEDECVVEGYERCVFRVTWGAELTVEGELDALRRRATTLTARFEALRNTVGDLVSGEDLETVLRRITQRAATTVRAPQYLLAVRLDADAPLRVHAEGVPLDEVDALAEAILEGTLEDQPQGRLVVDVVSGHHHYGRLAAMHPTGFLPDERNLLAAYATVAAAALDAMTALEEARRHARETEVQERRARALLELAQRLARVDTSEDVAARLAEAVTDVVGCERGSVLLYDRAEGVVRVAGHHGYPAEVQPSVGVTALPFTNLDLINEDYLFYTQSSDSPEVAESLRRTGTTALVVAPLVAGDRFFGFVTCGTTADPEAFVVDAELVERLRGVASQAATALQNAELLEQVRYQALHDPQTGLPNQRLLADRAEQALARGARNNAPLSMVFCDLDRFKKVNDSLGHAFGNRVLEEVAERLAEHVRAVDTIARVGGDEFVLLLEDCSEEAATLVAEKLRLAFRDPLVVDGQTLFMTASIGVATAPTHGDTFEALLRHADVAMYEAKAQGRNAVVLAKRADPNRRAYNRLALETDLHSAIERNELRVVFQPQVDVRNGEVIGAEALVRWDHPVFGRIPPDDFLPIAEDSGLVADIDHWMIREVTRTQERWFAEGVPEVRVAVNVADRTLRDGRLTQWVKTCLGAPHLSPASLEVEITERVAVHSGAAVRDTVNELRALGVRLAIDDFGTGSSSLARLSEWRFDTLKLDRAFVEHIGADGAALAASIVNLGHNLGVEVIGEGVETHEQAEFLMAHGCFVVQGYLCSRPLEADAFVEFVRKSALAVAVS